MLFAGRSLSLIVAFPLVSGFRTPVRRFVKGSSTRLAPAVNAVLEDENFDNVMDLVYMADINVGGTDYPVQLDTGSSDLWVRTMGDPLPNVASTDLTLNITYTVGYAAGHIARSAVTFAGFTVPSQALLQVEDSQNAIFTFGAVGILGLGFNALSSINGKVTEAGGDWGGNFLYNVFGQDKSAPNHIAFLLERSLDQSNVYEGSFTIGELEPQYSAAISATEKIPTWPVSGSKRWTILLDAYELGDGVRRTISTKVDGAPSSVVLLDTGASYTYAPKEMVDAIYGSVSGAQFDSARGIWTVPCDQQANLAFWIAGRKLDWHPLDLVVSDLGNPGSCMGSVIPSSGGSSYDIHAGDVFLRSLYNLFDFGDFDGAGNMGDPYVQLLTLVDISAANQEYHQVRGGTLAPYKSSVTGSANAGRQDGSTSTTVSASQQLNDNVNKLMTYAPIALGILGVNTLLLVVIIAVASVFLCRRNKGRKSKSTGGATGGLIPLTRTHVYQPVTSENPDPETPASIHKFSEDGYAIHSLADDSEKTAVSRNSMYPDGPSTPARSSFAPPKPSHLSFSSVSRAANVPLPPNSPSHDSSLGVPLPPTPGGSRSPSPSADQQTGQPIPRSKEYLMAMEARKGALAGADARRNTYNDPSAGIQPVPPQHRFQGVITDADGGRRATFHGANEGFGAERSTIYFDAPEGNQTAATSVRGSTYESSPNSPYGPGGHQRTGSSASGMRTPGASVGSPLRSTFSQSQSGLGSGGIGHMRNGSSSLVQLHARNGSMTGPGWIVAEEESDLTEQKGTLLNGSTVDVFGDQPPPPRMPAASGGDGSQRTSYAM